MAVILTLLPSGTLISALQNAVVVDLGLTIAASGTNTITQEIMDSFIEKGIRRINRELELALEIQGGDLIPARPAEAVLDLIILQTECLLHKRQVELATTSSGRGVKRVKLEAIEVEFDSVDKTKNLDAKYGFCQELKDALLKYQGAKAAADGAEIIWSGSTRRWEIVDHDGTTADEIHYNQKPDGGKWPSVDPGDFDGGSSNRFGG